MATPSGKIVWFDIMAPDDAKAEAFYTTVFDWKVTPFDMGPMGTYKMVGPSDGDEGSAVGGITRIPDEQVGQVPCHWLNYIACEDVDLACEKVHGLGGKIVHPPFDIPEVGRTAICLDPQGAVFAPFRGTGEGSDSEPTVWTVCWNEVMADDVDAAKTFYAEVFGYSTGSGPMEGYVTLQQGDKTLAGVMETQNDAPPHWLTYVWVDDIDAVCGKVTGAGGQVIVPTMDIPTVGKVAICMDDQGGVFGIFGDPAMA